jgi:uracil-DNA glycosylase family 4
LLPKPPSCSGCPLSPLGEGFMIPSLASSRPYRVALVGEALGVDERDQGAPFVGRAGFKLTRLIEWAGFERERFDIWNTVWCQPPENKLEGQPYESGAVAHCRAHHWSQLLSRPRVVVPMGNVAMGTLLGRKGILKARGYVYPGGGFHLLPTVHPSFIQRGQSKYSAAFIHDLQKAVELAEKGLPIEALDYVLDPSPRVAYEWALHYRRELEGSQSPLRLAYDIETPHKGDDEGDLDVDDASYTIWRVGFSYSPFGALSVPWTPPYIPAIRLLLESQGEKVVWNAGYDNPRIRAAGVGINGLVHDGMVAWHILHSDLPKGLGFVATFTCPWQPAWKHLSGSKPAFYNATDADVELRSFLAIEAELRRTGLWEVYQRDVLDLEPILVHMSQKGMPIDQDVRADRAARLADKQAYVLTQLEGMVPLSVRTFTPKEGYVKTPEDTSGCVTIEVPAEVRRCGRCGLPNPTKPHFSKATLPREGTPGRKKADRVPNPCLGGEVVVATEQVQRFARLDEFKPSRNLLIRYQQHLGRHVPRTRDKKTGKWKFTTDEKALKELIRRYPDEPLYPGVLEYRELDKLAGTYIGRPRRDEGGDGRPDPHDLHAQPLEPAA